MIQNLAKPFLGGKDTDRDWSLIGRSEPFWGVVSFDYFKSENLTDQKIGEFYESGFRDIEELLGFMATHLEDELVLARCLDFGCGVGRLIPALKRRCEFVVGYDISDGMLDVARKYVRDAGIEFTNTIPTERFDWINSYIVFQHIAPQRGLSILKNLLELINVGGVATIQFTISRLDNLNPRINTGLGVALKRLLGIQNIGSVSMFDYNLSEILQVFHQCGFQDFHLKTTDHGGHLGVWVVSRKLTASNPS